MDEHVLELTPTEVEALWWIAGTWDSYAAIMDWFQSVSRPDLASVTLSVMGKLDRCVAGNNRSLFLVRSSLVPRFEDNSGGDNDG